MRSQKNFFVFALVTIMMVAAGCGGEKKKPTETVVKPIPGPQPKPWQRPEGGTPEITPPRPSIGRLDGLTIVVDAGHGGKDPGASFKPYGRLQEKTITLDIARRLQTELKGYGARVIMTRSTDVFIELEDRADISNRNKADFFIAVHADSNKNRQISGATVYTERNAFSKTETCARRIANAISSSGIECRGVRQADYKVLKNNKRPAILVECGYMTNRSDAADLNDPDYRQRLAEAIAKGIVSCFGARR